MPLTAFLRWAFPDSSSWLGFNFHAVTITLIGWFLSHFLHHSQENFHKSAVEQIYGADRSSILGESRDLFSQNNALQEELQRSRQRLTQQLKALEEQSNKRERQLKRQCESDPLKCQRSHHWPLASKEASLYAFDQIRWILHTSYTEILLYNFSILMLFVLL